MAHASLGGLDNYIGGIRWHMLLLMGWIIILVAFDGTCLMEHVNLDDLDNNIGGSEAK